MQIEIARNPTPLGYWKRTMTRMLEMPSLGDVRPPLTMKMKTRGLEAFPSLFSAEANLSILPPGQLRKIVHTHHLLFLTDLYHLMIYISIAFPNICKLISLAHLILRNM